MPPPPGSRFGGEQRSFDVGSTRATLTNISTAGLIVRVTISGTLSRSEAGSAGKRAERLGNSFRLLALRVDCLRASASWRRCAEQRLAADDRSAEMWLNAARGGCRDRGLNDRPAVLVIGLSRWHAGRHDGRRRRIADDAA